MARKRIRVLIVEDSLFFREFLVKQLAGDAGIEVVGAAADPLSAREQIEVLEPDVLTLDVEMPYMSGIEFLGHIMPKHPLPVVVVSSISEKVFEAMNAGAVDFITKPQAKNSVALDSFIRELIIKIKIASIARVGQHKTLLHQLAGSGVKHTKKGPVDLILIGASTGGTEAVHQILQQLPDNMPPILIVQHMPPVFTRLYAERLNNACSLVVREAGEKRQLNSGEALIAAGDYHLVVQQAGQTLYALSRGGEKVSGHRPSVDMLFDSASRLKGKSCVAVILTGMGSDGASAMLSLRRQGALTIGQDEESSVVYGMPRVAFNIGAVMRQAPLSEIASLLVEACF